MDAISFSVRPASLSSLEVVSRKSWKVLLNPFPNSLVRRFQKTHPEAVDFERLAVAARNEKPARRQFVRPGPPCARGGREAWYTPTLRGRGMDLTISAQVYALELLTIEVDRRCGRGRHWVSGRPSQSIWTLGSRSLPAEPAVNEPRPSWVPIPIWTSPALRISGCSSTATPRTATSSSTSWMLQYMWGDGRGQRPQGSASRRPQSGGGRGVLAPGQGDTGGAPGERTRPAHLCA